LSLVARLGRDTPREAAEGATVVVDFTHPESVLENIEWSVRNYKHAVVGTTGLGPAGVARVESLLAEASHPPAVLLVPNFSLGALLARRFSEMAAQHFDSAEITEYYSSTKAEAPAGTSREVAKAISDARNPTASPPATDQSAARGEVVHGIPIHAVRMPGFVSRQEVMFADGGELLSVRFETLDRKAYAAGILKAIKAAVGLTGLRLGLDSVYE